MAKERKSRDLLGLTALVGILLILLLVGSFGLMDIARSGDRFDTLTGDRIGLVEILGPIYDAQEWVEDIDYFRRENDIKALVIRIDSPGGGVAASQELYNALVRARSEKPVIVSMGSIAASGGYYAAMGADTVVANPGTTTGSIGVLLEITLFKELMEKIGVDAEAITSGQFKDAGSPFEELTPADRAYFQAYVDDAYEQFIQVVADERGMEIEEVKKVADGRVFTGRQAKEMGLVDVLGDRWDALRIAGELTGLGDEPDIEEPYEEMDWVKRLMDELSGSVMARLDRSAMLQYRWRPEVKP